MDKKKSKQQDVLVIGAGASGMMTAITAARRGLSVTVLEHMDKPGKKILATGNGKCNFTNLKMSPRCYYGDHGLVQEILKQFTVEDTLAFFREIGIWPKEKNGYVYPNSGQASSVADALSAEMKRSGVSLVTSCDIRQLCETKYGFEVRTSMGTYCSHNLVFATGLRAAPKSGSDGSMISLIKSFGHRFEPILPALCGFLPCGFPLCTPEQQKNPLPFLSGQEMSVSVCRAFWSAFGKSVPCVHEPECLLP